MRISTEIGFSQDYKDQAESQNPSEHLELYSGDNYFYAQRFTNKNAGIPIYLVYDEEWNEWFCFEDIELTNQQIDFAISLASKMSSRAYKRGRQDQIQDLNATFKQLFGGVLNSCND